MDWAQDTPAALPSVYRGNFAKVLQCRPLLIPLLEGGGLVEANLEVILGFGVAAKVSNY